MEIKKGDKVRVSEDTPKMYLRGWRTLFKCHESTVVCVEGDDAGITVGANEMVIPTKYLIKVDAEKKQAEPKFEQGCLVRNVFTNERGIVCDVRAHIAKVRTSDKNEQYWDVSTIEYATAKLPEAERGEKDKTGTTITFPVEVDLTDSFWESYTADLAKELVLKIANKYNQPHEAAEEAVRTAKEVVKHLKAE